MSQWITGLINIFRFHKLKIALGLLAYLIFLLALFPFDDLSDLVTAQVARLTQNQVFLQFSDPGLSFFPQLGLKLENVYVENPVTPPLKAESLSLAPSILSLLALRPGMSFHASQLLGGDLSGSAASSKMKESKQSSVKVSIEGEDFDLAQLWRLTRLPTQPRGRLGFETDTEIDFQFKEQPNGTISLSGKKLALPSDTVPSPAGPITLPDLNLSILEIEGELRGGKLVVQKGVIGQPADALNGTVRGQIDLSFANSGGQVRPVIGGYDFDVNLNINQALEKKAALFLIIIDSVKKKSGNDSVYKFKISSPSISAPPKIKAL